MLKVLTTGRLSTQFYAHLQDNALGIEVQRSEAPSQADIDWADCLACFPIGNDVSLQSLKWIHSFGAGVDGFLERDDLNAELKLSRTTGTLGAKAAEFCLCHILNFLQDTFAIYEDMRQRVWRARAASSAQGKTVLLLGTGAMAQGIAHALGALGMRVIGVNTTGRTSSAYFGHCLRFDAIHSAGLDITCIINTLPYNSATERLLDEQFFAQFEGALLINIGRGRSLHTQDLRRALDNDAIAYCVLDVFDIEPLPPTSWLWQHPKVFVSPHQAAITDIDDVLSSFMSALHAYTKALPSECFVDRRRGY